MANRLRSVLLKMYSWASDAALLDVNPVLGTKKPHREGRGKTRVLRDGELRTIWRALDTTTRIAPATTAALRVLISARSKTRPSLDTRRAVNDHKQPRKGAADHGGIPAAKMKARKIHTVPLPPLAREIIATEVVQRGGAKPEFVFSSRTYTRRGQLARNSLSEALARFDRRSRRQRHRCRCRRAA